MKFSPSAASSADPFQTGITPAHICKQTPENFMHQLTGASGEALHLSLVVWEPLFEHRQAPV
jgi:hypothetical protein